MLTHLEFEQVRRAIECMRTKSEGYGSDASVKKTDVLEILVPYVDGYKAPDPHAPAAPAVTS